MPFVRRGVECHAAGRAAWLPRQQGRTDPAVELVARAPGGVPGHYPIITDICRNNEHRPDGFQPPGTIEPQEIRNARS
ncbi:MAG TPA: hypothetical protein VHI13_09100 [Candidatus Kapabacteria bacterium]|nr:hypothetical protein [Candidatus Kapabacteria bacterium]